MNIMNDEPATRKFFLSFNSKWMGTKTKCKPYKRMRNGRPQCTVFSSFQTRIQYSICEDVNKLESNNLTISRNLFLAINIPNKWKDRAYFPNPYDLTNTLKRTYARKNCWARQMIISKLELCIASQALLNTGLNTFLIFGAKIINMPKLTKY